MKINKRRVQFFSLLELMVAISILAIAAGGIFWRINTLIERNRFDTDAQRFCNLLLTSRMLAINTQSDWRLQIENTSNGWDLELVCREDLDQQPVRRKLSSFKIEFEGQGIKNLFFDFFSSGQVFPKGALRLIQDKKGSSPQRIEWKLPELFHQEQGKSLGPMHPKELEPKQ